MAEKRAVPRVEPKEPMSARVKASVPARIVDLSERGVQLELASSLRPQVPCDLRIKLEQGEVAISGVVRRCRAWGFGLDERDQRVLLYRAGLEFKEPPPAALVQVVASVLEKAPLEEPFPLPAVEGPPMPAPGKPVARAPERSGRVKIRIAAENLRKVLDGGGGKGEK